MVPHDTNHVAPSTKFETNHAERTLFCSKPAITVAGTVTGHQLDALKVGMDTSAPDADSADEDCMFQEDTSSVAALHACMVSATSNAFR